MGRAALRLRRKPEQANEIGEQTVERRSSWPLVQRGLDFPKARTGTRLRSCAIRHAMPLGISPVDRHGIALPAGISLSVGTAHSEVGLDRRAWRRLPYRRDRCARQRRRGDRGERVRCGDHDGHRGRRGSHQRLQFSTWGRFFFWLILGVLYIVAGFVAFSNPFLAAVWAHTLFGRGAGRLGHPAHLPRLQYAARIALDLGRRLRPDHAGVRLGAIILAHWPLSAVYTLGIFLGVDLVFAGVVWISPGLALRRAT